MSDDRLPTDMLVNATTRVAAQQGVPIVVLRKGDNSSGSLILKINRLDGTAQVLTQVRFDDELVWCPVASAEAMPESEADDYLRQQTAMDPDGWLLEIEDRQGRHWFPGRIVRF